MNEPYSPLLEERDGLSARNGLIAESREWFREEGVLLTFGSIISRNFGWSLTKIRPQGHLDGRRQGKPSKEASTNGKAIYAYAQSRCL